jgi:hypothetical protein
MYLLEQMIFESEMDKVVNDFKKILTEVRQIYRAGCMLLEYEQQYANYERDLEAFKDLDDRLTQIRQRYAKIKKAENVVNRIRNQNDKNKALARLKDHKEALGLLWNDTKKDILNIKGLITNIVNAERDSTGAGPNRQRLPQQSNWSSADIQRALRYVDRENPQTKEGDTSPILRFLANRRPKPFIRNNNGRLELTDTGENTLAMARTGSR